MVNMIPDGLGFSGAIDLGDKLGKMNVITTGITEEGYNWGDRYNLISGIDCRIVFSAFLFRYRPEPGG